METVPWLKVLSDRLAKPGIKPANPALQGEWFIYYTTVAPFMWKLTKGIRMVLGDWLRESGWCLGTIFQEQYSVLIALRASKEEMLSVISVTTSEK